MVSRLKQLFFKKKVLVVVGSGASVEFGMYSMRRIDELIERWSLSNYSLANNPERSLYSYIKEQINSYYQLNPNRYLVKETNFEEVLYVMLQLSSYIGDSTNGIHRNPIIPFLSLNPLPLINSAMGVRRADHSDLRSLVTSAIDKILIEFRSLCLSVQVNYKNQFGDLKRFLKKLTSNFDTSFISLNYDNLITQAVPSLYKGFNNKTGELEEKKIFNRKKWHLIYHLHGSVHYDMQGSKLDMHRIKWNEDLTSHFNQNSSCRNSQSTPEGIDFPTSCIVAGYNKTNQIQRPPFRVFFSVLDKLITEADAFIFLGYGFGDLHLNNSFFNIRNRKRPVIVIDYAEDDQEPLNCRNDNWSHNLCNTIPVNAHEMFGPIHRLPADIGELKDLNEFETSSNCDYPLAVWYGGFLKACQNYKKIFNLIK